jgi:ankyrin repeat protein
MLQSVYNCRWRIAFRNSRWWISPETDDNSEISSSKALVDEFFPDETDDGFRFGKIVQFSHFSVKEFLMSARFAESNNITLRRYHVSRTAAHTLAARACLGVLLSLDGDVVTSDTLAKRPLAKYSARHWVNHTQFEDVSQNVEDGMKQLFDPSKSHFARCFRICNSNQSVLEQSQQAESPLTPRGTPLHYAALWGFDFLLDFLITEHAQEVDSRSFANDMTPLHLASMRGHVKVTRILVEGGADTDSRNGDGIFPSDMALAAGHMEVAGMLTNNERGADVTVQDANRNLTDRGAGVTAQDEDGETPLHLASLMGRVEVAHTLIERGADVTAPDDDGKTPLHLASQMGRVEVVRVLIERGADVTSKNENGETPLHLVSTWSSWLRPQDYARVAGLLIEHGANVNARNSYGSTPFRLLSQRWDAAKVNEVKRVLLDHGADPGEMPAPESSVPVPVPVLPTPSPPSPTTPDTDLSQTPSLSSQSPSDDDLPPRLPPERNHRPVFLTRHFLLSLGIVAIAVAIPLLFKLSRRR